MGDKVSVHSLGVSARDRAISRRVNRVEATVNNFVSSHLALRADLNRESGARRVRFGSTWREHNALKHCFDRLEEDYFRLREDFDLLLEAVSTLFSRECTPAQGRASSDITRIMRRRRLNDYRSDYHAHDAPSPRPPSPYAVIDSEHNAELGGTNANIQG